MANRAAISRCPNDFLLILAGTAPLFAIDVNFTPPIFGSTGLFEYYVFELNHELERLFKDLEIEISNELKDMNTYPGNLIGAFATSSVFSSSGASQLTYGGYKTFAFTLGSTIGLQLPVSIFSLSDEADNFINRLENDGDRKLGFNPQLFNAQLGINTSFFLKNLYLGLKFGFTNLNYRKFGFDGLSSKTFSAGFLANYKLIAQRKSERGFFLWRGINFGTGFIYQNTNFILDLFLDPIYGEININDQGLEVLSLGIEVRPRVGMNFFINTYTVPMEAITTICMLDFFNLSFGLGGDFGFGSADLIVTGKADINFSGLPLRYMYQIRPAYLSVTMGGNSSPDIFSPKIMTGLGFSLGPVIIDIPFSYYFLNNGYNLGLSLGIVM